MHKDGRWQLSRALRDNFQWCGTPLITFYNDGPHDFYFDGRGGSYYAVHT